MFVLRGCCSIYAFDVFFNFSGNINQAGGDGVEYGVAGDAGVAEGREAGDYGCVFGAHIGEECGEGGYFEIVFVGGVTGLGGEELDEFFEVFDAVVEA